MRVWIYMYAYVCVCVGNVSGGRCDLMHIEMSVGVLSLFVCMCMFQCVFMCACMWSIYMLNDAFVEAGQKTMKPIKVMRSISRQTSSISLCKHSVLLLLPGIDYQGASAATQTQSAISSSPWPAPAGLLDARGRRAEHQEKSVGRKSSL